jgi:argininosuccinate lyase
MKLWQKEEAHVPEIIERFTSGTDRELDLKLAAYDVLGSLAHAEMLRSAGLLSPEELGLLQKELRNIYEEIRSGQFAIEEGVEDVHSQIELLLVARTGEAGKKIHSGRSRNDQVLLDIKLYCRDEIYAMASGVHRLFTVLQELSEKHRESLLPGYTHMQLAMPSSFGLWFGAYAESLADDMEMLLTALRLVNKNPLGSAAGYGSSFPLNRQMTTNLLGFESMHYNSVYAQMSRGKTERTAAMALSCIAATLSKFAMDVCLYMNQNFAFISFPDHLTTGSSIMPHKKNPDVFELIRARCNRIQAIPNQLTILSGNLPSGYHRDMQLTKECLFPAFKELKDCLEMTEFMLKHIEVKQDLLDNNAYASLFTVEAVNAEVLQGVPFREAYKKIGRQVEEGTFTALGRLNHTHEGSIGNLCNDRIKEAMHKVWEKFLFSRNESYLRYLLGKTI